MASDTANSPVESRKKHRRSADDESGESSKRRKHHRHRHHRHRSKKHDAEDSNLEKDESAPSNDFPPPASIANSTKSDYDMEEGEIIEEDNQSPGGIDDENAESNQQGINTSDGRDNRMVENRGTHDDLLTDEDLKHKGNIVLQRRRDDSKLKDYSDERSSSISLDRVNGFAVPLPKSDEEKHHVSRGSLPGGNYRDDDRKSSKSSSHDSHRRERSRSRSRSVSISTHFHEKEDKNVDDPYDGTVVRRSRDHRHDGRDSLRGDEDRDKNIYSEPTDSRDRHCTVEGKHRDRERMNRDLRREKDKDSGSYRDKVREREFEMQRVKDKEPERARGREREKNRVRDRELEEYREKDTDSDRNREKERRSRIGRVVDMDRERERSRGRSWDRGTDWNRERATERDENREGAKEKRSRERGREDRDRETEKTRDGLDDYRDRGRDTESDRISRHHNKCDSIDARRGERDNCSDKRHDENAYHRDWPRAKVQGASLNNDSLGGGEDKLISEEEKQEDYQEKNSLKLVDQDEEDINRVKEKSRMIQQAILEKYKTQSSGQVQPQTESEQKDDQHGDMPGESAIRNDAVPEKSNGTTMADDGYAADPLFGVGNSHMQNGISAVDPAYRAGGLGEGTPKSERSTDMFCDDIFGESPVGVRKRGKGDCLPIERSGLHDNWDDAEGYYSYRFGELLDGRYEITAAHGKGVFSTVIRAKDLKAGNTEPDEVAIKIIRNNETMFKAGQSELVILKKLAGADPDNKRHCVRFMSSFKYRNHLCLVFESLHMNLREILKKYGRNVGLKLTAVRVYANQLFIAMKHLRNCGVLHCDIKPDNMLVNSALTVLKLCDFGNAMFAGKNEITPYLVSRFYRAPEIILGLPYDHPMDIWSVGCCLFELYSGKVLFPGATNNDMLRLHMELKGPFPKKMLRKGAFIDQHFDQDLNFLASEEDPVTKKAIKRIMMNIKPKDIGTIITGSAGEDPKMLSNFKDLLDKIFALDPDKRMTVSQALNHPFITGK